MPTQTPQLGSVVWAEVADPNGFRKSRPAVIATPTSEIVAGKDVRLVAITTRITEPVPDEYVILPWDPTGKSRSGLRRKSAAVANWQLLIPVEAILSVVGVLPPESITNLLAKIAMYSGGK